MKETLVAKLRCPVCLSQELALESGEQNEQEVRSGQVQCRDCARCYTISDGLVFLYDVLSPEVIAERAAAELEDAADTESSDRLERLQRVSHTNALSFLEKQIASAKTILELGAGTGWLSCEFASYRQAVALDMYPDAPRGLGAADAIMKEKNVFIERVVADMTSLPFADESFDLVFVCAALHHSSAPEKTIKEVKRILRPEGKFILVSEPVRGWKGSNERSIIEEDMKRGFHEARYTLREWLSFIEQAGFKTKPFLPDNMAEVLASRGQAAKLAEKIWRRLPNALRSLAVWPILTLFDGFFNLVAVKQGKG